VASGPTPTVNLPGVALAALASLGLGAVIGPEAPLIALGSGLAVAALRLTRKSFPKQATAVVGASGSFAAISTLLGSPLLGAFLLMEMSGFGGAMLGVVLVPGLLASGIGALIFTGLGSWTGLGTYSLTLPNVPHATTPDAAGFGWALLIGVAAALLGVGIRWLALHLLKLVEPRRLIATVLAGVIVGVIALVYAEWTGHPASGILYSGQSGLGPLLTANAQYSAGALTVLVACKAVAYCVSMAAFRGGPVFPAMFVGAAGGIALSHLPGLGVTAGLAMGVGAMSAAMLKLPMTALLLATLLLGREGLTVMPLVIVAVVVSYVLTLRSTPPPTAAPATEQDTAGPPSCGPRCCCISWIPCSNRLPHQMVPCHRWSDRTGWPSPESCSWSVPSSTCSTDLWRSSITATTRPSTPRAIGCSSSTTRPGGGSGSPSAS
ncbi:MAG: chloride channel protein, partial [Streptomyces sp.]|uniref:chloride channel protein n=1 Tax=Streptomyces sp. TaxID=1931 RepID=UPI0025F9163F